MWNSDENYYGYTLPEYLFFGENIRKTVDIIWSRTIERKISEINSFLGLIWTYSPVRFERACGRALYYNCSSIPAIIDILEKNLDTLPLTRDTDVEGQFEFDF